MERGSSFFLFFLQCLAEAPRKVVWHFLYGVHMDAISTDFSRGEEKRVNSRTVR